MGFKKQTQEDYVLKLIALQEKVNYLEDKVKEYENDIERNQEDLKHKSQTVNKLASINDNIQSTLSEWPTFEPPKPQPELLSRSMQVFEHELVALEIGEAESPK